MTHAKKTSTAWQGGRVYRSVLPRFEYHRPASVQEALGLIARWGRGAALLAGGTDLVVRMKMDRAAPEHVIDIKRIAVLGGEPRMSGATTVVIPPLTTLAQIAQSTLMARKLPVLTRTALLMASPQVRNRATVGGNLANAAPSADMAPPLIALGARVKIHRKGGIVTVPLEEFFTGPGQTVLGSNGILGAILVPVMPRGARATYHPLTVREAMDLSIASAAVYIERAGRKIAKARIALGAVAPTPVRVPEAEALMEGSDGGPDAVQAAAQAAASACRPITDVRASESYRRHVVAVIVSRALSEVLS